MVLSLTKIHILEIDILYLKVLLKVGPEIDSHPSLTLTQGP